MSDKLTARLLARTRTDRAHRSAHAHQPARAGVEDAGRHPGLPLLHRAGPLGRAAARAHRRAGARPEGESRPARREARRSRQHHPGRVGCSRCAARSSASRTTRITPDNWESLYDAAAAQDGRSPTGKSRCCDTSRLEQVFLTNDFDDPLEGFDTQSVRPLPADRRPGVSPSQSRRRASGWRRRRASSVRTSASLTARDRGDCSSTFVARRAGLRDLAAARFCARRRCDATSATRCCGPCLGGAHSVGRARSRTLSRFVFWTLAEMCAEYRLPFDLMIGVNRRVYEAGVYQGQDLFDQRTSLIQYRGLFNAFPQVTFPDLGAGAGQQPGAGQLQLDFPERGDQRALVVLEHSGVHRARLPQPAAGRAADEADRLLQRHVQAGIRVAEVRACTAAFWPTCWREDFVVARGWSEERALELGPAGVARQRRADFRRHVDAMRLQAGLPVGKRPQTHRDGSANRQCRVGLRLRSRALQRRAGVLHRQRRTGLTIDIGRPAPAWPEYTSCATEQIDGDIW